MERPVNPIPCTAASASAPPTTYVQADAHAFRDLVQRLTGADSLDKLLPVASPSRPAASSVGPRRQAFKLQERRGPSVRNLEVQLGLTSPRSPQSPQPHLHHHHHHHLLHHSPPAIPSPVTPLGSDPMFSPQPASEEERAIAEKGFYFQPSPRSTAQGFGPPELLPLFPLCSPQQHQSGGPVEE